jgi:ABC-type transport system involved in cytochrome c biogenesis permease subunit
MNPKQFLTIGGIILVLVGILGMMGPIGPTAADSIFGSFWWFDSVENWAHLVLGIVALIAAFVLPGNLQRILVILVGILGIVVAAYNLMGNDTNLLGALLQSPPDLLLHLVVGIWALVSALGKKNDSMNMASTM